MKLTFQSLLLFTLNLALLLLSLSPPQVNSARILSVAFISTKSHKITYQRLLQELASRGHDVTLLSPIPATQKVPNLREILTLDFEAEGENGDSIQSFNLFDMKEKGETVNPFLMLEIFGKFCEVTFDLPHVQALLKEKFDLVMVSGIFNECALGFAHKFNTSLILMSPVTAPSWIIRPLGGHSPPSFVPSLFNDFRDDMNFYQRTINFVAEVSLALIQNWYFNPWMETLYRNKLGDPTIPSVHEILKNASLILSNGHFTLGSPRPFLPDVIEVGGMHCKPAAPLPKDLEDFVNRSGEHGFILFSMGSAVKGSEMPEPLRKSILGAFGKLKQNVLWKWETETMADLPKNVKLSKWLPQQDILGHPKIRAFITHGGFGSTTEAAYHGVPLIGIPMFGDQQLNMDNAEKIGFAIPLDYFAITEETLLGAINKILENPKYKESANAVSRVFRDQPDKALDRAVFWTEYILRHKGAVHLRSAGRELNFAQYHSLDVIGFLLGSVLVVLYLTFAILRFTYRKICGGKSKTPSGSALRKKKN